MLWFIKYKNRLKYKNINCGETLCRNLGLYIYIYIYICVCVCVCVSVTRCIY